jgi:hypothetical protein
MQPFKRIAFFTIERHIPNRSAALTGALPKDRFRIGAEWYSLDVWEHGTIVDEIACFFGLQHYAPGDFIAVHSALNELICHIQINEIRMVDRDALTPRELRELGRDSRDELVGELEFALPRGWYLRYDRVMGGSQTPLMGN